MLGDLIVAGICAAALTAPPATAGPAKPTSGSGVTAIHAGKIVTCAGPDILDGIVLIRNGRIIEIGKASTVKVPAGARTIDARAGVLFPGLVAAYSPSGLPDSNESVTPDALTVDGFNFTTPDKKLVEAGVTSLYLSAPLHRLVAGQGSVVKPAGPAAGSQDSRIVRNSVDLRVSVGDAIRTSPAQFRPAIPPTNENPLLPAQRPLVSALPSQFAVLRQLFTDARAMMRIPDTLRPAGIGAPDAERHPAEQRVKLGPFIDILRGVYPLRVHADTVAEIRAALRFGTEQHIPILLEGAAEGGSIASEIAAQHVSVVASVPAEPGTGVAEDLSRPSVTGKKRSDNIIKLVQAGVKTAVMPASRGALTDLLGTAAVEAGFGLSSRQAIALITRASAEVMGVASRVGSIEKGKDADFLVLSGEPLASSTHIESTIVNGAVVYRHSENTSAAGVTAVRAGRIYTVSHGIIDRGVVLIRDGKIVDVRAGDSVPPGAKLIDMPGSVIMPGMIDCGSYLGLHSDAEPAASSPASPAAGPITGRTRLYMALRPNDPALAEARAAGVTSILLAPPAAGAYSGTASLLKTVDAPESMDGPKGRIVREAAAIVFNASGGSPRMAQSYALEELLQSARSYLTRRTQYVREHRQWEAERDEARRLKKELPAEPQEVPQDEDLDSLADLFRHKIPAFVHASRSDEIMTALKVFRDGADLPVTLLNAADAYRIPEEIRKRGVTVISGPSVLRMDHGKTVNAAAALTDAGVRLAMQTGSASGTQFLRLNAAQAVRAGLSPTEALRSITLSAAEVLHVQDRLGSLDAGKDADIVVLSGDPMELTSHVQAVFVDGKRVYNGNNAH
jgi:imidazolonepropionase-like amidohydrolase